MTSSKLEKFEALNFNIFTSEYYFKTLSTIKGLPKPGCPETNKVRYYVYLLVTQSLIN